MPGIIDNGILTIVFFKHREIYDIDSFAILVSPSIAQRKITKQHHFGLSVAALCARNVRHAMTDRSKMRCLIVICWICENNRTIQLRFSRKLHRREERDQNTNHHFQTKIKSMQWSFPRHNSVGALLAGCAGGRENCAMPCGVYCFGMRCLRGNLWNVENRE